MWGHHHYHHPHHQLQQQQQQQQLDSAPEPHFKRQDANLARARGTDRPLAVTS